MPAPAFGLWSDSADHRVGDCCALYGVPSYSLVNYTASADRTKGSAVAEKPDALTSFLYGRRPPAAIKRSPCYTSHCFSVYFLSTTCSWPASFFFENFLPSYVDITWRVICHSRYSAGPGPSPRFPYKNTRSKKAFRFWQFFGVRNLSMFQFSINKVSVLKFERISKIQQSRCSVVGLSAFTSTLVARRFNGLITKRLTAMLKMSVFTPCPTGPNCRPRSVKVAQWIGKSVSVEGSRKRLLAMYALYTMHTLYTIGMYVYLEFDESWTQEVEEQEQRVGLWKFWINWKITGTAHRPTFDNEWAIST